MNVNIYKLQENQVKIIGSSSNFLEDRTIFPVIAGFVSDVQIIEYRQEREIHFIWTDSLANIEYIAVCPQGRAADFYKMTLLHYARYNLITMPSVTVMNNWREDWKDLLK